VLLVDAEPLARKGLACLLKDRPALRVAGAVATLREARAHCERQRPGVIVLDAALGDALVFIRDLPRWCRGTRVLVLATPHDAGAVQRALLAGALGYVTRRDPAEAVVAGVEAVAGGQFFTGPAVNGLVLGQFAAGTLMMRDDVNGKLSGREAEVFRLIGGGLNTRQVAAELGRSVKTIETHLQHIKEKLHVAGARELQRRAVLAHAGNGHG
jgi:DNA-binding NarL/FixJ family response regulator